MAVIFRLKVSAGSFSGRLGATAAPPLSRILRHTFSRSYGATEAVAAQPLFDHDHHYCYEIHGDRRTDNIGSAAVADSEGSVPARGVQWVFMGNPSAKKHVYAQKLSKLLEVPHISIASLVRQELSPFSYLYKQIANSVNQGRLVPGDILLGLLSKRLEDGYYGGETGFILDGIPRTQVQAETLDQLADIDLVINFKSMEDCLVKDQENNILPHSPDSHNLSNHGSTSFDMPSQCMKSNCPMANTESVNERLQLYAKQSKPLEDYYRKQKKLLNFQVANAPAETWRGLLAALHLQHINAAHSSQNLIAGSSWL